MPDAIRANPSETAPPLPGRGLRVLVVEDDPDGAESLRQLLMLNGHTAEVARDGPGALERAGRFQPDVVLLDIGLPGAMDGLEVARRVGVRPDGTAPLLVALTGRGNEEDRRRSQLAGIHLHMVKPVDPALLQTLLANFRDASG
jgi:CheY-like chemotaxis protein